MERSIYENDKNITTWQPCLLVINRLDDIDNAYVFLLLIGVLQLLSK